MRHYLATLQSNMKSLWDKPALCNYRGETITNGQLAEHIAQFALAFENAGIKPGDKIAKIRPVGR